MTGLQELITRGRFLFSGAPKRLDVYKLINGKRSTKEIAVNARRSLSAVLHDIEKLTNMELVQLRKDKNGNAVKKEKALVYEKASLIKHVPLSYFESVAQTTTYRKVSTTRKTKAKKILSTHIPTEQEILDISNLGEDQHYEFKSSGTDTNKITKEIAAFLHTRNGGIVFYGIEDDGSIIGSDMTRQILDQRMQNSIRNTISPQPNVVIRECNILGSKIIMIIIPPWDRKALYQYTKTEKYYIRKGTNIFALKPIELKKLSRGQYVI